MSDLDIEFTDLPPDRRSEDRPRPRASRHWRIAEALRERPGDWALIVRDVSPGELYRVKTGEWYQPSASFEIVSRRVTLGDRRKVDIYARYVGGAS